MNSAKKNVEPVFSTIADDPHLGDIVKMFVSGMPERIAHLRGGLQAADWDQIERSALQLKGSAGSYGFHRISPQAAAVEEALRRSFLENEVHVQVHALIDLCDRATAETP